MQHPGMNSKPKLISLKYFPGSSRLNIQKEEMNDSLQHKKNTTRRFAMKAIITLFTIGLVYFTVSINYMSTCLTV